MDTSQAFEKFSYRIFDPGAPSKENNFIWPQVEGCNIPTDEIFSENELDIFQPEMNRDIRLVLNDATFITDVLSENIFLRNGVLASDRFCDAIIHSNISKYKIYSLTVVNRQQEHEYNWVDLPQIESKYIDYDKCDMVVSYFDGRLEPLEEMSEEKTRALSNELANSAKGVIKYKRIAFNANHPNMDLFSLNTPDPVYFISPHLADKLCSQNLTGFSIK